MSNVKRIDEFDEEEEPDTKCGYKVEILSGVCDELAKIAKPSISIAGTDDIYYSPYGNALVIASKVPGA